MLLGSNTEDILSEARALRVRYIRGLLIGVRNAVLGFFRSAGQVPMGRATAQRNRT
jgi:hypothetical protein